MGLPRSRHQDRIRNTKYFGEKGAEIRQEVLQNTPVDREREERRNG